MEQKYQEELKAEELEEKKKESFLRHMLSWIGRNIKFLLIPGSRLEDLSRREFEYEKTISKRKFIRRLKSILTILGIFIVFSIITLAVLGPWIAPYTFEEANGVYEGSWEPPSDAHPLGTTLFGRDVLARVIYGANASLRIALPAITLAVILGTIFGVIAGFYGGWIDTLIMRIADIIFAFPSIIFIIIIIGMMGETRMEYIMLAISIFWTPFYARLIRGSVLQARELPYVQAARASGSGNWRLMFKHVLPNTIQPIIISFTFDIGGVILTIAGLSFLGFSDYRLIEWGNDLNVARVHFYDAIWTMLFPGIMISLTVLGFMLVGDGLRDALDPRLKNL
ncbi:MAG TPA: ABC transporter permease [archaeon]|nr:ABC transporter permease [archaeon]